MFDHLDTFLEVCQNENCFSIRPYFHQRHLSLLKMINYFLTKKDLIFSTFEQIFNSHFKMCHYFLNSLMHHRILKSIWSSIEKLLWLRFCCDSSIHYKRCNVEVIRFYMIGPVKLVSVIG